MVKNIFNVLRKNSSVLKIFLDCSYVFNLYSKFDQIIFYNFKK